MGESQRDKEAKKLQGDIGSYGDEIRNLTVGANNRFDNFELPFDYGKMSGEINKLTQSSLDTINRNASDAIQTGQSDVASRMASQGITGGSVLNSQVGNVANNVNKQRFGSMQDVLKNKSNLNLSAMGQENANKYNITNAAQNVDFQNIANLLSKYGMLGGTFGMKQSNLQNLSGDTWFDDILGVVNTAGGFINPLDKLLGSGKATGGG